MKNDFIKIGMKPPHPGEFVREEILEQLNVSIAKAAMAGIAGEDKALINAVYNQGVEQMQIIAKGYNDQLDVFEYRQRIPNSDQGVDVLTRGNRTPSTRQSSSEEDD